MAINWGEPLGWVACVSKPRSALADVVNAISPLDTSQTWGEGKTSASDGQRFAFRRKVLQQNYSHKFSDYALEFYSFVADNYAPFYSVPIECNERDAAYVLDGLLYIDPNRDYGALAPLFNRKGRTTIKPVLSEAEGMDWIVDQWDRMGQFYRMKPLRKLRATLKTGHTTASVALKRLNSMSKSEWIEDWQLKIEDWGFLHIPSKRYIPEITLPCLVGLVLVLTDE